MNENPYIDIHSHLNFSVFEEDRDEVILRAQRENVYMINVGTQLDTSKSAIELAEKYEKGVFACVGVHPIHSDVSHHDEQELGEGNREFTSRGEKVDEEVYRKLASHKKVVAIGECGLDYYRNDPKTYKKQVDNFLAQIRVANSINKPLMLHVRKSVDSGVRSAYLDVADIIKSEAKTKFNFHFFAGTLDEAKVLLDMGAMFSFTGVITFAKEYKEIVLYIPNDRIFSETDSPYVAPIPYRGKRNESAYVIEVVNKMAEIKGISPDTMKDHIWNNAKNFFGIER